MGEALSVSWAHAITSMFSKHAAVVVYSLQQLQSIVQTQTSTP